MKSTSSVHSILVDIFFGVYVISVADSDDRKKVRIDGAIDCHEPLPCWLVFWIQSQTTYKMSFHHNR